MTHSRLTRAWCVLALSACMAGAISGAAFGSAPGAAAAAVPQDGFPGDKDARHRTYLQNYKDMLLASCIAKAYAAAPEVKRDAEASAGAYNEFGSFDAEHDIDETAALPQRYLAQDYGSFQGPEVRLDFMKCMDMYHGKALDRLARKQVSHPARSFAQDNPE